MVKECAIFFYLPVQKNNKAGKINKNTHLNLETAMAAMFKSVIKNNGPRKSKMVREAVSNYLEVPKLSCILVVMASRFTPVARKVIARFTLACL